MLGKIKRSLLKKVSHGRRDFLKLAGVSSLATLAIPLKSDQARAGTLFDLNWWYPRTITSSSESKDYDVEYCLQHNVNPTWVDDGIIWSNLDNIWRPFEIRELSDYFMQWGCSERYFYYENNLNPPEIISLKSVPTRK